MILDVDEAKGKSALKKLPNGSVRHVGKIEAIDTITLVAQTYQKNIKALRIEALADADLPKSGPGLAANGGFAMTELTVQAAPLANKAKVTPVKLRPASGDKTTWSVPASEAGKNVATQFDVVGDLGDAAGPQLTITMKFDAAGARSAGRACRWPTPGASRAGANVPGEFQHRPGSGCGVASVRR